MQHIAFDCKDVPMKERKREMRERGFEPVMEGIWKGRKGTCNFCFFDARVLSLKALTFRKIGRIQSVNGIRNGQRRNLPVTQESE